MDSARSSGHTEPTFRAAGPPTSQPPQQQFSSRRSTANASRGNAHQDPPPNTRSPAALKPGARRETQPGPGHRADPGRMQPGADCKRRAPKITHGKKLPQGANEGARLRPREHPESPAGGAGPGKGAGQGTWRVGGDGSRLSLARGGPFVRRVPGRGPEGL